MSTDRDSYRVAWVGPADSDCEGLLNGFLQVCDTRGRTPQVVKFAELRTSQVADCDRIVLVAPNRHEYPHAWVRQLTSSDNVVPWGVVTGCWYVGSRRSGDGPATHFQQPWFRWWDSWFGWFFPELSHYGPSASSLFSPIVTPLDLAMTRGDAGRTQTKRCEQDSLGLSRTLYVLGHCSNTVQMWGDQARHAGWHAEPVSTFADLFERGLADEAPILWDDSLLPCLPNTSLSTWIGEQIAPSLKQLPAKRWVVALGLENIFLWPSFMACGCRSLLIKPSYALALATYLDDYDRQRQFA